MTGNNQEYVQKCLEFSERLQAEGKPKELAVLFQELQKPSAYPKPHLLYVKEKFQLDDILYFLFLCAFLYETDTTLSSYVYKKNKGILSFFGDPFVMVFRVVSTTCKCRSSMYGFFK